MSFTAQLGGGKKGDPTLLVKLTGLKNHFLFDCGDTQFQNSIFRKIGHLFVTHTHMDHFIGFDKLIRLNLTNDRIITVYGPPGINEHVRHKLQGYSWNITDRLSLKIISAELFSKDNSTYLYEARDGFKQKKLVETIDSELPFFSEDIKIKATVLDHRIPSIAYSIEENIKHSVMKNKLDEMGFKPGPWVGQLKKAVVEKNDITLEIDGKFYSSKVLSEQLLIPKETLKITYVVDAGYTIQNREKIISLASKSNYFYCEAYFLERDKDRAVEAFHLTAKQTGMLAREAGVKNLIPLHISKRYINSQEIIAEIETEFPVYKQNYIE